VTVSLDPDELDSVNDCLLCLATFSCLGTQLCACGKRKVTLLQDIPTREFLAHDT